MEKPVDTSDLGEHMAAYVEAAELRMKSLERAVDELRKEVEAKAEKVAELSERQVDVAAKELEAAAAVRQYVALQQAIRDPGRVRRIRKKERREHPAGVERRAIASQATLEELSTLTVDAPLTLAEPTLRFVGEVVEAE
jgi:predicted  nucleic acid-binding Zn-ribbon protein